MDRLPILFIGHGSPMNAIEDNEFTRTWAALGEKLPRPEVILTVSAHWVTEGSGVCSAGQPQQIYDMYGFPRALYELRYAPPGSPATAARVTALAVEVREDNGWGLDHGAWSVLAAMYPKADIPVLQLSLDARADRREHFLLGRKLRALRDEGVLILGSGNVVHNLGRVDWDRVGGFDWADDFDAYIKGCVARRDFDGVIDYKKAGLSAKNAFYTTEHFDPLLYVLGAAHENDRLTVFNDTRILGAISMTGYLFEA
jgi:4,5-DOPA dioxygenase extradiol